MAQTKLCSACNTVVPFNGHGLFTQHACPGKGTSAVVAGEFEPCPSHGTLVWTLGPYSAYRVCGEHHNGRPCVAGKNGKPWRYTSRVPPQDDGQPTPDNTPKPTPTPAPEAPKMTPAPSPAPAPAPTPRLVDAGALNAYGPLGDAIAGYVEARATSLASEMIAAALKDADHGPRIVEWRVNGTPIAKVDGAHHAALPRLLKLYAAGFRNFLVVGPAGSGKTTLAHNMATALKLGWGSVSCTSGMSESALTGRAIPNLTTGETAFQTTEFVTTYEGGGVYLIDEVDAADPNVMLVINSALANGHMPLPNRAGAPSALRSPESVIICAANTWGTGADRQYVGRNQLDAAFLDRFVGATIPVDYDTKLEAALVGDAHICAKVWAVRSKVAELKLRRVVGTRFLLAVTRLVKSAGETIDAALLACTEGWTTDERAKVGVRS